LRDSLHSIRSVWANAEVRRLLLLHWLLPSCALAPEALIAPYVHVLHGPSRDVGLLLCAVAAGMLLANLLAARLLTTAGQRRLMVPFAVLNVAGMSRFLAAVRFAVSVVLMVAIGIGSCY